MNADVYYMPLNKTERGLTREQRESRERMKRKQAKAPKRRFIRWRDRI